MTCCMLACRESPSRSFKSSSLSVEIPTNRAEDTCDSAGSGHGPLTGSKVLSAAWGAAAWWLREQRLPR